MASALVDNILLPRLAGASAAVVDRLRQGVVVVSSPAGGGSGTIWRADGLIVTNHHVVRGDQARVLTWDDREHAAEVVARDEEHDLAALRVAATGLPALEAADSSAARVGQLVLAAGNPWGQRGAITAGIIFSTNGATVQNGVPLPHTIRADLRLAPGNSGGPMVDAEGRVLGINSMIAGGMAVAIPSNVVSGFVAGELPGRGFIGIAGRPVPLPPAVAASFGAADGAGLILTEVVDGSPAAQAGLMPGDVVVGLGREHGGLGAVAAGLRGIRAGRPVRLSVLRGGAARDLEIVPAPWA